MVVLDGEVEVGVEDVPLEVLEADLEAILVLQLSHLQVEVDSGTHLAKSNKHGMLLINQHSALGPRPWASCL